MQYFIPIKFITKIKKSIKILTIQNYNSTLNLAYYNAGLQGWGNNLQEAQTLAM